MLRIWKTCDGHSGLFLPFSPWNVVSRDNARVHDFHHSQNRGSFGSFFHVRAWHVMAPPLNMQVWDWLCGTDRAYHEWKHKQSG